jgi:hypothetical protein
LEAGLLMPIRSYFVRGAELKVDRFAVVVKRIGGVDRIFVRLRSQLAMVARATSAHAPRHEAARLWMTIQVVGPNHRAASAVLSIHHCFIRNVNPLAIDAQAIVTVFAFQSTSSTRFASRPSQHGPLPLCKFSYQFFS